jgi:hypothetical protein
MDLNHIELPAPLVAGLYHDLLIMEGSPAAALTSLRENVEVPSTDKQVNPGGKWPLLGENRQHVLVVVEHNDVYHLPDDDLNFLTKILGACKLTLGDVAIVNINNYDAAKFNTISTHFKSIIVLLFGIEPARFGLPISFPHFQVQAHSNTTYLFTPTLQELTKDDVLKSKCWVCLKRIFNVK